ncbi:ATP-binding protein [Micromonospora carbonacea]|uniref:ATP-binding protein n=1 Tax=Micromonospora carbonacea TaxID=47853 RepID=UPI003D75DB1F
MTGAVGPSLDGGVSNTIGGGVFFHAVVQGRDVQVVLPREVTPALTGLPPASPVFTGRAGVARTLRDGLRPDQPGGVQVVSAVAGLAGVGKTEVVLHTAHRVLAEGWFPGGVLFVDMFGYDPDRRLSAGQALAGWLSAIGIPGEHIPAGEQDRSRLWRSVLDAYTRQERRLLLIIDNASAEEQVRPLLPADARTPVLVTSRHTLDLDARLHDLDTLDAQASLDLITRIVAGRRGPDDPRLLDATGLAELAGLCAGLPLALRIVAALLADRPHLHPHALAGQLRDDQYRLDGLSRQQAAVRAAFDLSHQHLTDAQARLFRLLPVNPGPDIATGGAARLVDLPEQQTTRLLADLHRAHLITEPAPDRWGMHDLVRLYATDQQTHQASGQSDDRPPDDSHSAETETEAAAARRRLYDHYRHTAATATAHLHPTVPADTNVFPDRKRALAWLDAEHTNLIAVAITAPEYQRPETTTGLAFALVDFLLFRRHFTDLITITTRARDICQQIGDLQGEGAAWNNLGLALAGVRRFDEAITAHTHDLNICQQTGDLHDEGTAWNNLGNALAKIRRFDEAITAYTHDLNICQQTGDLHGEGQAWNNLGLALAGVRRFDEAITAHTHDLNICQQTGDLHGEGQAWNNLGLALRQVRRFDEAITAHTRARDIYQQTSDLHREGQAWNNLGNALAKVRRFDEAITAHTRARDIYQQTSDLHGEGQAWNNLGNALAEVRRFDEAITAHTRARDIYQQTSDLHGEGQAWNNLGLTLAEARRFGEARGSYQRAIAAFTATGDTATAELVQGWLAELPQPQRRWLGFR